jgi:hypothetical protein
MRPILPLLTLGSLLAAPAIASEAVSVPGFRSVELHGGGRVTVVPGSTQRVTILEGSSRFTRMHVEGNGQLRIDTCNEQCPRQYRLTVQIQSPAVPDLAVSGGGIISAVGGFRPQSRLATAVNGGGRIDARAVEGGNVSAAVNGGGEVLVRPRSLLSAAVNGGGVVRYWGNPTINMAVHGGGAVTPGS